MSEIEVLIISICLYVSISISFFLYSLTQKDVHRLLSRSLKGSKAKKDLNEFDDSSTFYMKLSLIWPILVCLMLIKKIKS